MAVHKHASWMFSTFHTSTTQEICTERTLGIAGGSSFHDFNKVGGQSMRMDEGRKMNSSLVNER